MPVVTLKYISSIKKTHATLRAEMSRQHIKPRQVLLYPKLHGLLNSLGN